MFFLAERAPAGASSKSALPAHFHVRPVDKSVQGGKYRQKKSIYVNFLRELRQQKSFRKYIPLVWRVPEYISLF